MKHLDETALYIEQFKYPENGADIIDVRYFNLQSVSSPLAEGMEKEDFVNNLRFSDQVPYGTIKKAVEIFLGDD